MGVESIDSALRAVAARGASGGDAVDEPGTQLGRRSVRVDDHGPGRHRLRRGSRGGRPPAFDRETYKQRNTVERCINRLKQWRGIATRYEKTATIYLAGLHVAGIFLWSAR